MPKTFTGLLLIGLGGAANLIPVVGPVVSPWICKAGFLWATFGLGEKMGRSKKGGDPLENEKKLLDRIKKPQTKQ